MRAASRELQRIVIRAAALAFVAGCGDGPSGPPALRLCESAVTISVGTGLQPEFRWTPECRVEAARVVRVDDGVVIWTVLSGPLDERSIVPGLRYGIVPPGAMDITFGPPTPLIAGTTYAIVLTVFGTSVDDVGRQEFRP